MPFQWYPHFYHACPDIYLELVSAASGEAMQAMQLCWHTLSDREPAVTLVLLNIWPQSVFCKREENWGKIVENNPGRQSPKTLDIAEDLMEYFVYLFCSQAF